MHEHQFLLNIPNVYASLISEEPLNKFQSLHNASIKPTHADWASLLLATASIRSLDCL